MKPKTHGHALAENYFKHRTSALASSCDRLMRGEREVRTFITLISSLVRSPLFKTEPLLKGKAVVDLGAGDRFLEQPLINCGAIYRPIDIQECNLESESIPIESNSCDAAVSLAVIEHLRDPAHFLQEVKRVLRPGGVLWLSTPNIHACGHDFWNDPTHVHPYTRKSLKSVLDLSGFSHVKVVPNYRCKPPRMYSESSVFFFMGKHLLPFTGQSSKLIPDFLKGKCLGMFAICTNA